jgi:hypothetical protein
VPLAVVLLDQQESVRLLGGADGRRVPAYDSPQAAARALARAAAYGEWRAVPAGVVPAFPEVAAGPARDLVHGFLARVPDGGWLSPGEITALVACYGLTLQPTADGGTADGGTAVRIDVTDDQVFGPLISLDAGAMAPDGHGDQAAPSQAARMVPLTTTDAERLISSARAAPLPRGDGGSAPAAGLDALRDLLLRAARLAEDLPQISQLSLAPIIVRPEGVCIIDARARATPRESRDPFLRRLR